MITRNSVAFGRNECSTEADAKADLILSVYIISRFLVENQDIGKLAKSISRQYLAMWFLKMLLNSQLLSLPAAIAEDQGTPELTDYHGLLQPASAKRFKTTTITS